MEKKTIGKFIAVLRKANGMTQQEVADRLHVSDKAVSRWERDASAPDLSLSPALAELFGVTCDELLRGERLTPTVRPDPGEGRASRQVRALLNRALSGFRTLCWVSLALSAVGLVCMLGIAFGFYRPVIGFAVMAVFAVVAVLLGVLMQTGTVWTLAELFNGLMAIPNLAALLMLSGEVNSLLTVDSLSAGVVSSRRGDTNEKNQNLSDSGSDAAVRLSNAPGH